ncbi:hypothetical protein PRK78_003160 [Emydomyces testavorans]|uniref:Protein kinase domain-containing protein n=1 Tax=Emydomyces testavorans TaxID=2070801 RepID=A0AAF0DGA7_9EURO|nr:hypothetical protein PRK78_003160 [Emydomyces testavorans]
MAQHLVTSSWKLLKKSEMWNLETYKFWYTQFFFERQSENGTKIMTLKWDKAGDVDQEELVGQPAFEIPDDILYPPVCEGLTKCPFTPGDCNFIKGPWISVFDPDASVQMPIADLMIQEARICEQLQHSPHKNIAKYWGCIIEDGRVKGLCFSRYKESLFDRLDPNLDPADRRPLNREKCLMEIRNGLAHLHGLRLAHNDVTARNIMLTEDDDTPIFINFDACLPEGCPLGLKRGIAHQFNRDVTMSSFQNDEFGLRRIEENWEDGVLKCRPSEIV